MRDMVRVFGEGWGRKDHEKCETPTGAICVRCEKMIVAGDLGLVVPSDEPARFADGRVIQGAVVYHRLCFLASVGAPDVTVLT